MAYRGRLIFPFLAELYQLDTYDTSQDPDGAGPLESGYDPDFREPVNVVSVPGDQIGVDARVEKAAIRLPCQVEDNMFERMQQYMSGNVPDIDISLVFHFTDLENNGLVDAGTGEAMIRTGDRLGAIYDVKSNLVQEIRNPPGLYAVESRPIGWGMNSGHAHRNLLLVMFQDRERGVST